MASKLLTDSQLKAIRGTGKAQRFNDGDSLVLLVDAKGKANWVYRFRFGGRANSLSLKSYPEVGLKQARDERDALKAILLSGKNPSLHRKMAKLSQRQSMDNTFMAIAKEWHDVWKFNKTEEHAKRVWGRLDANVFPDIGHMPITDISTSLLKAVLKKVESRGALSMTKRVLNTCSQVFSYAINDELIEVNPAKNIDAKLVFKPHVEKHYVRITAKELPELLQRIDTYDGEVLTRYALKMMTYTFVRTAELIGARWDEIDFEKKEWRIPAHRMKMGIAHIVALSEQMVVMLNEIHQITGGREYVFPNINSPKKHMSNNTMLYALYRMGYQSRMTGHGFRGVASTILHELGYNHAHIEVQLAHKDKDKVSSSYNFAEYLEPRARMLQDWANYLDSVKAETSPDDLRSA